MKKLIANKYFLFISIALLIILISGAVRYVLSNSYIENRQEFLQEREAEVSKFVQTFVTNSKNELAKNISLIKSELIKIKNGDKIAALDVINKNESPLNIIIFGSSNILAWNKSQLLTKPQLDSLIIKWGLDNEFFYETSLIDYIAIISEVNSNIIFIAKPIQKKYVLHNKYFSPLNFIGMLSQKFEVGVNINFNELNSDSKSSPILNSANAVIGSTQIKGINSNSKIQRLDKIVLLVQSISLFLIFSLLLLLIYRSDLIKDKFYLFIYSSIALISLRVLFSLLNIGDNLGFQELVSPIYFSSSFFFGLAKSPIELFLTILSLLIISLNAFLIFPNLFSNRKIKTSFKVVMSGIILMMIVLVYNGFSSTIKSIIFDSSILYFKDASLLTNFETTFMYLNILFVGLIVVLLSISLITSLIVIVKDSSGKNIWYLFVGLVLSILIVVIVNEYYYHKSSFLLASIFVLFVSSTAYFWGYFKVKNNTKFLFLLLASSILSITFMNYFNSNLEKNSLKIVANELSSSNSTYNEYYVENAIDKIESFKNLENKINGKKVNFNTEAFLIWNSISLSSEVENATINIYDENRNLLGGFSYGTPIDYKWNCERITEKTIQISNPDSSDNLNSSTIVAGIVPIKNSKNISGFVEVLAYNNNESITENSSDIILGKNDPFNKLSVNVDLIKVYQFNNEKLSDYYTNTLLSKWEKQAIINSSPIKSNDTLISVRINNENNIMYIRKSNGNVGDKLVAVGLSDKNLTWNLYDFFKVFFIHSIMIIIFYIVVFAVYFKSWNNIRITFKSKILISLLLVSIMPLILLASYFKTISNEKNSDAINYKLGKRADNVEAYILNNLNMSSMNFENVFDKATRDLGINYSIYDNEELIYSSIGTYYSIGLLPKLINPLAYIEINKYEMPEIILHEKIEKYNFNSLYHKVNFAGHEYIIKINDLFNSYQLPMSGIELNVFLFGTYSLAIIFIIILSTILANEISSPIEKLTKATQSVSHGDLNIQLKNYNSGEVKELVDGFNLMVRELKKNQMELTEAERESAWREMAKQVAHEIKNPLTPMKLAVQHLVVAHQDKSNKFNSIFEKVTNTIITQIDILKNIASEFSNFAKMPSLKIEQVNVIEILNETINLFIDEECEIKLETKKSILFLSTDKEQFQRMIINLIRNSIQAKSKNIIVKLTEDMDKIILLVIDDGVGIPSNVLPKIFDYNFTTKKEGMGLGLALSKRFADQTNGELLVVDTSERGTTIKFEMVKIHV